MAKTKAEHMRKLEVGPNRDELLQRARHLADGRRDERAIDCSDAGAGDQVDLGRVALGVGELAEDVLEYTYFVCASRTAS